MKKIVLILISFLYILIVPAQEVTPVWSLDYQWLFDNREYNSDYTIPQTIFGSRIEPQIGLTVNDNNSINIGAEIFMSMGKKGYFDQAQPLAYYNYSSPKINLAAGILPRSRMIGNYPTAFFSDSIKYYQPIIQGGLASYVGKHGYIEMGCSWVGMLAEDQREQFMIFSSAEVRKGPLTVGYFFNMMHYAMYKNNTGVVDNILGLYYIGIDIGRVGIFLDKLNLRGGVMTAMQRDRKYDIEAYPTGLYLDLRMKKWHIGLDNSLYVGDCIMPFYEGHPNDYYGADLYYGDPFYRASNIYNHLEVYWQAVNTSHIDFRVSSVHHYDGSVWDWQQVLKLSIKLGGGFSKH